MKSDDILARLRQQDLAKPQHKDRHRIAFIALRDPIEQALRGGATAKRIWTLLRDENKISCSYYFFALRQASSHGNPRHGGIGALRYNSYGLSELVLSKRP